MEGEADRMEGEAECMEGEAECMEGEADRMEGEADYIKGEAECMEGEADCIDSEADYIDCMEGEAKYSHGLYSYACLRMCLCACQLQTHRHTHADRDKQLTLDAEFCVRRMESCGNMCSAAWSDRLELYARKDSEEATLARPAKMHNNKALIDPCGPHSEGV